MLVLACFSRPACVLSWHVLLSIRWLTGWITGLGVGLVMTGESENCSVKQLVM